MKVASILIIEDDKKLSNLLKVYFEGENFKVFQAYDGQAGLDFLLTEKVDIILLDLMLPLVNGLDVCKKIRQNDQTPILMLTAREEESDRIIGLELGADDYVTKPFSFKEVVSRVKAIIRRTQTVPKTEEQYGEFVIDRKKRLVLRAGKQMSLTATEFNILSVLAKLPGQVFSRAQLIELAQGEHFSGYDRTIDGHIKNLRKKLDPESNADYQIETVFGVGYRFWISEEKSR